MNIRYQWYTFDELTTLELYGLLRVRQEVFVVEQQCAYLDCDNLDQQGLHLIGWVEGQENNEMAAYLRLIPPGTQLASLSHAPLIETGAAHRSMAAIGRLLTGPEFRGRGLAREIMNRALAHYRTLFGEIGLRISAQQYLTNFYTSLGFTISSEGYEEDGIPHVEMTLSSASPHNNKQRIQR